MSQAAWSCCNKRSSKQSVQFTLTTEGLFRNNYQEEQIKLLVQVWNKSHFDIPYYAFEKKIYVLFSYKDILWF